MSCQKEMRQLLKTLEAEGYGVERQRRNGHYTVTDPKGEAAPTTVPHSPSDYRSLRNNLLLLRRRGFVFCFQGKVYGQSEDDPTNSS